MERWKEPLVLCLEAVRYRGSTGLVSARQKRIFLSGEELWEPKLVWT